jgi:hypothetical protein
MTWSGKRAYGKATYRWLRQLGPTRWRWARGVTWQPCRLFPGAHRSNRSVVSSSQTHTPTLGNDCVRATRLRVTGDSRGRPSVDIGLVRFVPLRTTAHALVGWQLVYCRFTRQDQWFRLVGKESFKLRSTVDPWLTICHVVQPCRDW